MGFKDVLKRAANIDDGDRKKSDEREGKEGKFNEPCALCGKAGTEKKWMGQYWHKACVRKARRMTRNMF